MYIHNRHFYEIEGCRYRAEERLREGWVFRTTEDDSNWTTYSNTTGDYFTNGELEDLDLSGNIKEVFREMKVDQKKEMFKFALKIASSGDIDGNLSGSDTGQITHFELEYGVFRKLWDMPISEERAWLDKLGSDPYDTAGVSQDVWFEEEEIIDNALCKLRAVKQYLAEMKDESTSS